MPDSDQNGDAPHVTVIPIADLVPDQANVRVRDERAKRTLQASLTQFGPARSIVVDGKNVVRAGNGTLEAAEAAGVTEAVVVEPKPGQLVVVKRGDWTATEGQAYSIADNRIGDLATWDDTGLAEILRSLESEDFDLGTVGFTSDEVDELIDRLADKTIADQEAETDFGNFDEPTDLDGFVSFRFGDYSGKVGKVVYDSFVSKYRLVQKESGEPVLDDVLRNWLGV